jgi:SAM-dependent methyltransferase
MDKQGPPQAGPFSHVPFDFSAYLEAKFAIDSASLNAPLYARFEEHLRRKVNPRILDLGTGTGAMLRRVLDMHLQGQVYLAGVDREEQNLDTGLEHVLRALRCRGYHVREEEVYPERKRIRAKKRKEELQVDLLRADLLEKETTERLGRFDCITAHAFMDLMPLRPAVAVIRTLLREEGVFYPTMNYDGQTVLLPRYVDPVFERRLLEIYNRSMERRRTGGRKTGGAFSGRRLYQALLEEGFTILGMGSSDWNVFPSGGVYSSEEKLFLSAILSMIAREAWLARDVSKRWGRLEPGGDEWEKRITDWHLRRTEAVRNSRLCLVVHQLDLLASAPGVEDHR